MFAIIAVVVAAVVIAGGAVAIGLAMRSDDPPSVADSRNSAVAPPQSDVSPTQPTAVSRSAQPSVPPSPTNTASSVTATAGSTAQYSGPGGITVHAPGGWRRDTDANSPGIIDFDEPGNAPRFAGATFRIGIGNPHPTASFRTEVQEAANFLKQNDRAQIVGGRPRYIKFLGTTCGDIQYRYYNRDYGVERRGIERLWRVHGQTYIIQMSGRADQWAQTVSLFGELTRGAAVG